MKIKLLKVVGPIFLSILCGFVSGRIVYNIYNEKSDNLMSSTKVYLLIGSSYNNYDEMKGVSVISTYAYYEEDGNYKTVVAITKNKDNIDKLKGVYGSDVKTEEYLISDDNINSLINSYDEKLKMASSSDEIKEITNDIINICKDEDVKMTKIS